MRIKGLLFGVVATTLSLAGAETAGADPTNSPNSETIPLTCDSGLGAIEVSTNGSGRWTPGLVTTNNQVGIPYYFRFVGSFTPTVGETEYFDDEQVKKAPRSGRLATCTAYEAGEDEFGSFEVTITVKISYTPAH